MSDGPPSASAGSLQLTVRAAVAGAFVGGGLGLANLYVVLKTGWSLGVTLTASLLAFALFRGLRAAGLVHRDLTVLENNAVGSVASAAAFMTGGGNMAALPALLLLTHTRPGGLAMFAWFATIAALGVVLAIPLKRQIIDVDQLPFPSAVATAETLRALHGAGGDGATLRGLLASGAVASTVTVLREVGARLRAWRIPEQLALPFSVGGLPAARWSLSLDASFVMVAGGALMGARTAWSMLLGAVLSYAVLAPAMVARGVITAVDYRSIVQFTLWPGAAVLVASGVVSMALQWRMLLRSLQSLRAALVAGDREAIARTDEAPRRWFVVGVATLGPLVVLLERALFGIPVWAGVLSVPLALVMGVVAARVTGETDITPTKALGPVTQALFGVALPGHVAASVMGANVTGGVGLHAADLLTDLKTGHLLGASPRQQVRAQFLGVVVGAAAVVPAFGLLVPDPSVLGSARFPAPAVMVWAGVSRALATGFAGLAPAVRVAVLAGLAVGSLLAVLEQRASARWRPYIPSAAGLGIAMVMPASSAITMCVGAAGAAVWRRLRPEQARRLLTPLASGAIAGESLVGVALAIARSMGW